VVGVCGGSSIPCAEYGTFGEQSLSDNITNALKSHGTTGCLMANHGVVIYGSSQDPNKTVEVAAEIENLAKQYHAARSFSNTEPVILSDEEMKIILAKFATYGKSDRQVGCLCEFEKQHRIINPRKREVTEE